MIDPMVWMQAAVLQIEAGCIAEAEMVWTHEEGGTEDRLEITVRREIKPFVLGRHDDG